MSANVLFAARTIRSFTRWAGDWVRGESDSTFFDLLHPTKLNGLLADLNIVPLTADPHQADVSASGAARFALGSLLLTPALRWYFPRPLSDGPTGGFARWVLRNAPASASANVRAVFDAPPGLPVRRVFEFREDLRQAFPLALTPAGRREYLMWLLTYGRHDFQLAPEAVLWFLFEQDEDPARGLAATYRVQPEWQRAVPDGLTVAGWPKLKAWVSKTYSLNCRWLKKAALAEPIAPPDPTAGVNIVGLFRYTSGLQQAVKGTVESLHRVGVKTSLRDYPVLFLREPRDATRYDGLEPFDITILNTGIDTPVGDAYRKSGLHLRPGVHRVGIWWWEMETLPTQWHDRGAEVDEIWAPTRFIADAMRTAFAKPVYPMPPGIELPAFEPLSKATFGMDANKFTVAFVFDMNSRMQRKNPLGLIAAFRRAFGRTEAAELVIKVSPPESFYKDQWELLRRAADDAGVTLLDRVMTRGELLAFLNAADCYASLHRSEGFGLTCAEAMLLGKPVVATGYSGNIDFMTADNSYLVDYRRVMLAEDIDPYPKGAVWADPDVDHAARLLRQVYENRTESTAVGERAKRELADTLSVAAAGRRMKSRLDEIRQAVRPRT